MEWSDPLAGKCPCAVPGGNRPCEGGVQFGEGGSGCLGMDPQCRGEQEGVWGVWGAGGSVGVYGARLGFRGHMGVLGMHRRHMGHFGDGAVWGVTGAVLGDGIVLGITRGIYRDATAVLGYTGTPGV